MLAAVSSILLPAVPQAQPPGASVVRQVDHVMIGTNERERLVALLADTLQLPVVWPSPGSSWTFSTGLALGNLNLEITPSRGATDTRIGDLAFQPVDFVSASQRLKARGLIPRDPGGYTDSAGVKRWSILGFRHPFAGAAFFLVQYHQFDMNERRARFQDSLRNRKGGPLGLRRIMELRLAYPPDNLPAVRQSWQRLVVGSRSGADLLVPPAGAAIRILPSKGPNSSSMLVEVESLSAAERTASRLKLVGSVHRDSIVLDPARFGGLRLTLVEPPRAVDRSLPGKKRR
ncbi:MAG: hypothetical protein ABI681_13720 [Gemmatimonadales bacterium]